MNLRQERDEWKQTAIEGKGLKDLFKARAEKAEAELAAARPLIEDAVDYVREHLADHLAALGETTAKNKGRADDMRRIIRAALAYRQRTERAPAGHEKEKGEGE